MDSRDPAVFPDLHSDTADRDSADELLTVMTVLQHELARSPSLAHTFDRFLPSLLKLSDSAFGLIGETRPGDDGAPILVIHTLSDISWDTESEAMFQQSNTPEGVRFERLRTLYGAVLTSRQPVLANDPLYDPRSGGLPPGHPALRSFMGVPLEHGGEMVGMAGLANRPGGYDVVLLQRLAPLFAVMGTLIGLRKEQSARQAAEVALRRSEGLHRTTFEMAAVGMAQVDLDGRFIDVNSRLAHKLGRGRDALKGMLLHEITHPDDLDPNLVQMQRLRAGEVDRFMMEKRYLRPDGSAIWAMLTVALVRDADGQPERYVAVIEDLTERRLIEQRLRERDDVLRKISRFVPGVMFQLQRNPAGRFSLPYASEGLQTVLGGSRSSGDGSGDELQALVARIEPDDLVGAQEALASSADSLSPWNMSFRLRDTGPSPRWFEARSMPERQPDSSVVWYGFIADITERKRYEAALISAEAAERANRAKTVFLSRMSHELRTPLNSVLGFAQLLRMDPRTPLTEAQRQQVGHIENAGAHLLAMVNDILDIARVESGTLALQLEAVPVDEVVDDTLTLLADMARSSGVELQRDDGGRVLARVDRLRLKQVLVNLLSNAIKFNQRGGFARVAWQREIATGAVCISVTDTGPGLNEAQMQQLFEPFNRLGAERSRVEGTGIGLVITRGLLESMDGALDVQSSPGLGSRFTAVLPAA